MDQNYLTTYLVYYVTCCFFIMANFSRGQRVVTMNWRHIFKDSQEAIIDKLLESFKKLGETITIVEKEPLEWYSMTEHDFSQFDVVAIFQPLACVDTFPEHYTPFANSSIWGKAITGNSIILGIDESNNALLSDLSANYSAAKASKNKTGLYISLASTYRCGYTESFDELEWLSEAFDTPELFFISSHYYCGQTVSQSTGHPILQIDSQDWSKIDKSCIPWTTVFRLYPDFFKSWIDIEGYGSLVLYKDGIDDDPPRQNTPSTEPTGKYEQLPSNNPSTSQTISPSRAETYDPTKRPTFSPSIQTSSPFTLQQSNNPSTSQTNVPSRATSDNTSKRPTKSQSNQPSSPFTQQPSNDPSTSWTHVPSRSITNYPSMRPTNSPSIEYYSPSTQQPHTEVTPTQTKAKVTKTGKHQKKKNTKTR